MKFEAKELIKDIEEQKKDADSQLNILYNLGLDTAISIIRFHDKLSKIGKEIL